MIGRAGIALALVLLIASPAAAQPSPTPVNQVASATNDFGLRLLRQLTDGKGGNVVISPLSVALALGMTYNGAAGETKTAMAKTLGIASMGGDFNPQMRAMADTILKADPKVQMEIANALWAQAGFSIETDFLKLSRDFFDASVESLDFAGDPKRAGDHVNDWVKNKTHSKIPSIIGVPPTNTRLILTDAVYFKGRWSVPFDKKRTEPRTFHLTSGGSMTAPMMVQDGEYDYLENDSFQAIRLPYGNSRFAMYVFLPRKTAGVSDFLSSLDLQRWNAWIPNLADRKGEIILPRLESSYGKQLNGALKAMGMSIAFDPGANFSLIHSPPPSLNIDDIEHKTYIKVDEEGTEAAAATSVGMGAAAVRIEPPPFQMIVDHPFFIAIVEQQSGAMLFVGVVTNPS